MKQILTLLFGVALAGCVNAQVPAQNVQVNPQTQTTTNLTHAYVFPPYAGTFALFPNYGVLGYVLTSNGNGVLPTFQPGGGGGGGGIFGATAGQVIVATGATAGTSYAGFTSDTSGNVAMHTLIINGSGAITFGSGILSTGGGSNFESNDFISNTGIFRGTGNTHFTSPAATVITSTTGTFLGDLSSNGLVKTTGGSGQVAIATPGTDYEGALIPVNTTVTGTYTVANPTGSFHDGDRIFYRLTQDASGGHAISLGTKFRIPTSATNPLAFSTAALATDILAVMYRSSADLWDVVSFIPGY